MDIEIIGNHESARELIELTKQWDRHLEQCNAHALMQGYADNVEVFDIGTQLVGRDKFKELWQSCFPFFGSSPKAVRRKLKIYASQDLAFLHCYSKICGSNQPTPARIHGVALPSVSRKPQVNGLLFTSMFPCQ
jgi:ketosteroid isomerase-like protein